MTISKKNSYKLLYILDYLNLKILNHSKITINNISNLENAKKK